MVYKHIGRKIKTLAKVLYILGMILSVLSGLGMIASMGSSGTIIVTGILTMLLGALLSWVGSFVLYGFGQLVDNSDIQTEITLRKSEQDGTKTL